MRKLTLLTLLLAAVPVFGQLENHTLSISASRSSYLQPDQVLFGLAVTSGATTSLDQVVAALPGLGITDASLTSEYYSSPTTLIWSFSYTAPISGLTAAVGSITKLQQTIAQSNSGLALTFTVEGTQVSQQLRQAQSCSNSDLIADATAQAQKLAAAAGLSLGPILKFSNAPSPLLQPSILPVVDVINGSFGATLSLNPGAYGAPGFSDFLIGSLVAPTSVPCSLLVKFQLLP
jgi:uncharacterized protein YggE